MLPPDLNNALVYLLTPALVLMVIFSLVFIIRIMARNYIKVAPNEVLVIYGRRYKTDKGDIRGFRLITGGAGFCIPLLEQYRKLPLDAFQINPTVHRVPSLQGVRVSVASVSSLKIGLEDHQLESAVNRFLNRSALEIQAFAKEVLEGALRGVVATMTVEQLVQERTEFGNKVQEQVMAELDKLGLVLDNFLIQDVSDDAGYIDALGKTQTANVKRDAATGEAEAMRDQEIKVAEANKDAAERASAARQAGEIAKAKADQEISNASRQRDVQIAQNSAQVQAEQAKIQISAEIASAEKDRDLRVAKVRAQEAEVEAQTELQKKEKERHDKELEATLIVQAEREKEARIIASNATKQATILEAEGNRTATEEMAAGQRKKLEEEASGRKAAAEATQKEQEANAAGTRAKLLAEAEGAKAHLLAEAEGSKAKLLAEADGTKAKLLAEAEGVLKKAEAYRQLDQAGKLLLILEHLPEILIAAGDAVNKAGLGTLAPMAQAIGTGLAGIEEVRVIDLGGGGKDGGDALSRFIGNVPRTTFDLLQQAHALGLNNVLAQICGKLGIDLNSVMGDTSHKTSATEGPEDTEAEPMDLRP